MQSLIRKLVQIHNDWHLFDGACASFYLKTRFTPREIAELKRELTAGKYTLELRTDSGIVETLDMVIPGSLVKAIKSV